MTDPLGAQGGATGGTQSGAEGTGTDPNAQGQGAQSGTGTPPEGQAQSGQTYSETEYKALMARMQAADKRASENEAALRQLRDKDMPELQKAQRDLQELTSQNQQLTAELGTLRIANAFLTDNSFEWHNAEAAMQLLDRSRITIDSDGKVTGMKDALKALATAHPYLLKPKAPDQQQTPPPPPGTPPANGGIGGGAGTAPAQADLMKRFPAMRSRI